MSQGRKVHIAGGEFDSSCHACAFFSTDEQGYKVLLPFIKQGIDLGERAFHIVDPRKRARHLSALAEHGIDLEEGERTQQIEVRQWEDAYLKDGHFDQERQLALIQEVLEDGRRKGFPITRLVAHMEWALEDRPGVSDIVAYESRLNEVLPRYDDTVVCTYDLSRFSAMTVMDILRTHPFVIIGETMQRNPFYVPPDQLLAEMASRAGSASA